MARLALFQDHTPRAVLRALEASQAMIEFELDGTVRRANQRFLDALGYTMDEIRGRPHSLFVDPAEAQSPAYRRFWDELRAGKAQVAQFRRIGKGGRRCGSRLPTTRCSMRRAGRSWW